MKRHGIAFAAIAVIALLGSSLALAAEPAPREFAPVQDGYVASAETVLPWAPDRVLIQLTPQAMAATNLASAAAGGGTVAPTTLLPSLDAVLADVGAQGLRQAFARPMNKAANDPFGADRWFMVDVPAGSDIPEVAARLVADANLEYALPDLRAFPAVTPNDPLYPNNWGHDNTAQLPGLDWGGTYGHTLPTTVGTPGFDADADLAWSASQAFGTPTIVIAILDSGVDVGHPDLLQVAGWDYGDGDANPDDDSAAPGHGTACAGVAAAIANNGTGAVGVAGGCSIMPLKVSDSAGSLFFSYIINGVYHAADNGADVISMSFGAAATAYAPMDAAVTYAYNLGVTLLAATGNENAATISYPAYNPQVIGVGAASPCGERKRSSSSSGEVNPGVNTDPNGWTCDGERWWGSNYGASIQDHQGAVDIIAPTILPTTDIQGAGGYDPGNYSGFFNGTSCSTPYAAGVCALILSANPGFTPAQVWNQLTSTAVDVISVESGAGWDRYTGYGMVNAANAVGYSPATPPVAAFTESGTNGCVPFAVNFTDQSTGTVTNWSWNFGDFNTSTAQNPTHVYAQPGIYTVSLTVSGSAGANTLTKTALITVGTPPAAAFGASAGAILTGDIVTFTDLSSANTTGWNWSFGDGGTSTLQNPVHPYTVPGVYDVRLIATNSCGADTMEVIGQVTVADPAINVAVAPVDPAIGTVSLFSLPDGTGDPLAAALQWSGTVGDAPVVVDATIEVVLTDGFGNPVPNYPAANITVQSSAGGWNQCTPLTADGPTDALGRTLISGPLFAGGTSGAGELLQVVVNDPLVGTTTYPGGAAGLDYRINSADLDGDLASNLIDVPLFAGLFYGTYGYGGDFLWDGVINLSDLVPMATGLGSQCPAKKADEVAVADGGRIGLLFEDGGPTPAADLAPGRRIDAYVVLEGEAARAGISAYEFNLRTSANVTVHAMEPVAAGLDLGAESRMTVGYAAPRKAVGVAPLRLAHLQISVSDNQPAHFWLEPGVTAGLDVPALVREGEMFRALPVSGAVDQPVASLNDKDFALDGGVPLVQKLAMSIAPNPFNPMTEIRFGLPSSGRVELRVFDAAGRVVTTLVDSEMPAGVHTMVWNGTDRSGRKVASGVYFSSLRTDTGRVMQKMLLMK